MASWLASKSLFNLNSLGFRPTVENTKITITTSTTITTATITTITINPHYGTLLAPLWA